MGVDFASLYPLPAHGRAILRKKKKVPKEKERIPPLI
jgi:hypothetical protein